MGVHGLWDLLSPVGRRVSVDCLAGKRVAVDASIWMVQFLKATAAARGDDGGSGDLLLLAFFRRVCKLLFLRCKPVFVFDGAAPPLKRRTLALRRRQRDQAQAKLRKTAERLLLSHLRTKRLEDLADEVRRSRAEHDANVKGDAAGPSIASGEKVGNGSEQTGVCNLVNENRRESGGTDQVHQEKLDEMLAASLAAEEAELVGRGMASTSGADLPDGSENDEDDEEMILPAMDGKIDPAVLASLPPSMQLHLLMQMRERVMAENRQKYQKIKAPAKFSELQIESYLRTVAFRREINDVQKSSAGTGPGDLQACRIASESNREFVFSSAFTGDKQILGRREQNVRENNCKVKSSTLSNICNIASTSKSSLKASASKPVSGFGPDVETYRDERGCVRLSKVRAMGIRMTRDIQRNLDFMREHEQSRGVDLASGCITAEGVTCVAQHPSANASSMSSILISKEPVAISSEKLLPSVLEDVSSNEFQESLHESSENLEISFVEDQYEAENNDDQFFLHLASGSLDNLLPDNVDSITQKDDSDDSASMWEDGVVGEQLFQKGNHEESDTFSVKCSEEDVELEEGLLEAPKVEDTSHSCKPVSKGVMEEEALLQEAIKRSLLDLKEDIKSSGDITNSKQDFKGQVELTEASGTCIEKLLETRSASLSMKDAIVLERPENVNRDTLLDAANISNMPATAHSVQRVVQDSLLSTAAHNINMPDTTLVMQHVVQEFSPSTAEHIGFADTGKLEKQLEVTNQQSSDVGIQHTFSEQHGSNYNSTSTVEKTRDRNHEMNSLMDVRIVGTSLLKDKVVSDDVNIAATSGACFSGNGIDDHYGISESNMEKEMSVLRQEQLDLRAERRKLEGHAEQVTTEMFVECQELLQMFGLPYIIAPMEAEAQCAYMEMKRLVDGVVTDDSDVFLFGARSVYKNIFDDRKYVETYFMKDIESELGLTREKLIRMALLLGSDYTEGVSGIGIVNAIEVVHSFPEEDGLKKFREWIESPDPAILEKFNQHSGSSLERKSSKSCKEVLNGSEVAHEDHNDHSSCSKNENLKKDFMNKHRNVSKNWHIPSSFPSDIVINAYALPQVDDSIEPFSWGRPDLNLLRKLCWERFGWNKEKADELLLPVLNEYDKHETQLRLEAFYSFNERFAKIRSQRIKKVLKGISGASSVATEESAPDDVTVQNTSKRKKLQSSEGRGRSKRKTSCRKGESKEDLSRVERYSDDGLSIQCDGNDDSTEPTTLRKSKRQKKKATYSEENTDTAGCEDLDQADGNFLFGDPSQEETTQPNNRSESEAGRLQKEQSPVLDRHSIYDATVLQADQINTCSKSYDTADQVQFPESGSTSKSYLFVGGGFCMDEDDGGGNNKSADESSTSSLLAPQVDLAEEHTESISSILGQQCISSSANAAGEESHRRFDSPAEKLGAPPTRGGKPSQHFSAMPSLRRKKGRS